MKILIVDDSVTSRKFHSCIVKEAGFTAVTAVDGADGLEKFFRESFDLVLTDINMQVMDGYEFIRRARQHPERGNVPILIISTEAGPQDRQKGFAAGANLYLVKPADVARVITSMQMVLGGATAAAS